MNTIFSGGLWLGTSLLVLMGAAAFSGCESGDSDKTSPDSDAHSDSDTLGSNIEWTSCPKGYADDREGFLCTTMSMPLNHAEPDGEQIDVLVYKYEGKAASKKGQVWFLMGGPGNSNIAFIDPIQIFAEAFPEWDFYSIEHRGVGASTRLSCPEEVDVPIKDTAACGAYLQEKWGNKLDFFTTTQAAYDVGSAIDLVHRETTPKDVFIYSVSYGTHWAQRYLQLFPKQVSGVILDSTCPPGACSTDSMDADYDHVGRDLMNLCADDETCSAKMSAVGAKTPIDAAATVFQSIDNGTICEPLRDLLTRKKLRNTLGAMLIDWERRVAIPPFIYRIARCDDQDVTEVEYLLDSMNEDTSEIGLDSSVLGLHIELSEVGYSNSPLEAEAIADSLYFSLDSSVDGAKAVAAGWPVYEDDGYMHLAAKTDIPILMLQGDLDPQTPYEQALETRDNFQGQYQYFFTLKEVPHVTVMYSQTEESLQKLVSGESDFLLYTCGAQILWSFIQNPNERPSDECMDSLYQIDFSNESPLNQVVAFDAFGSAGLWGVD